MARHIHIHIHDEGLQEGPGQTLVKQVAGHAIKGQDYGVPGMKKGQRNAEQMRHFRNGKAAGKAGLHPNNPNKHYLAGHAEGAARRKPDAGKK